MMSPTSITQHARAIALYLAIVSALAASPRALAEETREITIGDEPFTLIYEPASVRADGFEVVVIEGGKRTSIDPPKTRTVKGSIQGLPGSSLAGTIADDGRLLATIWLPDGEMWEIDDTPPLAVANADPDAPIAAEPVLSPFAMGWTCGNNVAHNAHAHHHEQAAKPLARSPTESPANVLNEVELVVEADYPFFQSQRSSEFLVTNRVEAILNIVDEVFRRDANTVITLKTLVIRSSAADDPYTGSGLLNEFRSYWNTNLPNQRGDLNHLFTGRGLGGSVIGVAFVGTACTDSRFAVSNVTFSSSLTSLAGLVAHEIGHNLNAPHCDGDPNGCHIMCSGLGGCDGLDGPKFGPASSNIISNYTARSSCITPFIGGSQSLPISDTFAFTGTPNNSIWDLGSLNEQQPPLPNVVTVPGQTDQSIAALEIPAFKQIEMNPVRIDGSEPELALRFKARRGTAFLASFRIDRQDHTTNEGWLVERTIGINQSLDNRFLPYSMRWEVAANQPSQGEPFTRPRFVVQNAFPVLPWLLDDVYLGPAQPIFEEIYMHFEGPIADSPDFARLEGASDAEDTELSSLVGSSALRLEPGGRAVTILIDPSQAFGGNRPRIRFVARPVSASTEGELAVGFGTGTTSFSTLAVTNADSDRRRVVETALPGPLSFFFRITLEASSEGPAWIIDDLEVAQSLSWLPPICLADYNADGNIDTLDMLALLADLQAGIADPNADGTADADDIDAYFNAADQGCDN